MLQVVHMDCLAGLRMLPDNFADSIVTDPPYGLSFMGRKWDYDVPSVEIWAECLNVARMLAGAGFRLKALGFTDRGEPRHPLMLAYKTPLEPWQLTPT